MTNILKILMWTNSKVKYRGIDWQPIEILKPVSLY